MTRRTILTAAIALSSVAAAPALARTPMSDLPTAVVHYDDLDLSHDAGAARLDQRIRKTAETICGDADMRDLAAWTRMRACRRAAIASTDQQVAMAVDHARQLAAVSARTRIASR